MEDHYRKKHKENFTWVKCKLVVNVETRCLKNTLSGINIYSKNVYYMKPKKLEDLLNTEHYNVILVT